jgi:hypothetical protein
MKRIITFLFAIGFVLYMGSTSAHAQGKGPGSNPGPSANHGPDQGRGHDAKDVKETRQEKELSTDKKFQERLANDPEFKARITALLPKGMDLKTAEEGFKNHGQFIAAMHVAKNLNISFTELKAKMTGANPESLGKAIHDLRPTLSEKDANQEAEKAEKEAKADEKTKQTKPVS